MSRTTKQPYRGPRAVSKSCRCHGGCPLCLGNHTYQLAKANEAAEQELKELAGEEVCPDDWVDERNLAKKFPDADIGVADDQCEPDER